MQSKIKLSNNEYRKLALYGQGLLKKEPFGRGKNAVLKAIKKLTYLQIDAISVVERAHHHTLWNRTGNYRKQFLQKLANEEKSILEYWGHAASYIPMEDYRYYHVVRQFLKRRGHHWYKVNSKVKQHVLTRINNEGPLFSKDFEHPEKLSGAMWDIKPAKQALHELFMTGEIVVRARKNFQRQYDLPERVLPDSIITAIPPPKEMVSFFVEKSLQSYGLTTKQEICFLRPWLNEWVADVLMEKKENGEIIALDIPIAGQTYFALADAIETLPRKVNKFITFLSPFDNAVIQRKRLEQLFGFKYQTEIYYPKNKRVYGYFSSPVLYGYQFIGRIDPKADRIRKVLVINNLQIEPQVKIDDALLNALKIAINEFSRFNGCLGFTIENASPKWIINEI